jgi:hypothetical protein
VFVFCFSSLFYFIRSFLFYICFFLFFFRSAFLIVLVFLIYILRLIFLIFFFSVLSYSYLFPSFLSLLCLDISVISFLGLSCFIYLLSFLIHNVVKDRALWNF